MLDSLITSKTRLKMLLKFFINSQSSAYLRGLAEEFGESTNAIRHELNNLSKAGYLISREEGRTIRYQANPNHPLYNEVRNLVHKYIGIDKIIDNVVSRLGELRLALIVGDYAKGRDSGNIELVFVGEIDITYLSGLVDKASTAIKRKITFDVISEADYVNSQEAYGTSLIIWDTSNAQSTAANK